MLIFLTHYTSFGLLASANPMYSEKILDHYHHPRNVGEIPGATAVVEMTNPVCGDFMELWAVVVDGKISATKFRMDGCIPAVACASWLTETMKGKALSELASLSADEMEAALGGLPPASRHASALVIDALKLLLRELHP